MSGGSETKSESAFEPDVQRLFGQWMASLLFTVLVPSLLLLFAVSIDEKPVGLGALYGRGEAYLMSAAMVGAVSGESIRLIDPRGRVRKQVVGWLLVLWLITTSGTFGLIGARALNDESYSQSVTSTGGSIVLVASCLLSLAISLGALKYVEDKAEQVADSDAKSGLESGGLGD